MQAAGQTSSVRTTQPRPRLLFSGRTVLVVQHQSVVVVCQPEGYSWRKDFRKTIVMFSAQVDFSNFEFLLKLDSKNPAH